MALSAEGMFLDNEETVVSLDEISERKQIEERIVMKIFERRRGKKTTILYSAHIEDTSTNNTYKALYASGNDETQVREDLVNSWSRMLHPERFPGQNQRRLPR